MGPVVFGWGRSDVGQLGLSSESCITQPTIIESLQEKKITDISASSFNSCFISEDGECYTVGSNDNGTLGTKTAGHRHQPQRVEALDIHKCISSSLGEGHVLVETEGGQVATFGLAEHGQLGNGSSALSQPLPRLISFPEPVKIVRVAAGSAHSLLLSSSGHMWSMGEGAYGALGLGDTDNRIVPTPIKGPIFAVGITQIAAGDHHSAVLSLDGRIFTWGRGKYGALGLGDFMNQQVPQQVKSLSSVSLAQVACGGDHTLALSVEGETYSWGRGTWGQCGNGYSDNTCRPSKIQSLVEHEVVQIAAGSKHSLVLTAANEILSFGDGELGQLGTGNLTMALSPKKVTGLPDLHVQYIATGGDHCFAVLVEDSIDQSSRAYGRSLLPHNPLPSLLSLCSKASSALASYNSSSSTTPASALAAVISSVSGSSSSNQQPPLPEIQRLISAIESIFTSPGFLTSGFALPLQSGHGAKRAAGSGISAVRDLASVSSRKVQPDKLSLFYGAKDDVSHSDHNVDVATCQKVYSSILQVYDNRVVAALGHSCLRLFLALEKHLLADITSSQLEWLLPLLLILFLNPLNGEPLAIRSEMRCLGFTHLIQITLSLPRYAQLLLARWLAHLPVEVLGGRIIRPLQRYLTTLSSQGIPSSSSSSPSSKREEVLRVASMLDLLFDANEQNGAPVPFSEFANQALSEAINLRDEYMLYVELRNSGQIALNRNTEGPSAGPLLTICQAPFLLNAEAKSRVLQGEASVQKQHIINSSAMSALAQGLNPSLIPMVAFLDIHVRRTHLLQDSLQQIISRPQDLKKPLRVTFISNGVAEEGVDEGGVSREFFQLLIHDLFSPDFGMFSYQEETRTYWFRSDTFENSVEFQLVGIILGLAIYNGVILDVHFPHVLYKKLLGLKPNFADLNEAQPALAKGFTQLLDYPGDDVESTFCLSFDVETDYFGSKKKHELVLGGSSKPVTSSNRRDYVELYSDFVLNKSVEKSFSAFAHGFMMVCGGLALSLFRYDELELLVCGLPHLDFYELEKQARYEGGYSASHSTVIAFWEVVQSFNIDQKKKFLSFVTGCDRAPVGGLGHLTLVVQRGGPDTHRLPTAHTCFNTILVPDYVSKEKLRDKLLAAVENAQGFGLK